MIDLYHDMLFPKKKKVCGNWSTQCNASELTRFVCIWKYTWSHIYFCISKNRYICDTFRFPILNDLVWKLSHKAFLGNPGVIGLTQTNRSSILFLMWIQYKDPLQILVLWSALTIMALIVYNTCRSKLVVFRLFIVRHIIKHTSYQTSLCAWSLIFFCGNELHQYMYMCLYFLS
jgi:hypothetical protein